MPWKKCSKSISVSLSQASIIDHNLIATTWKPKVPKTGSMIIRRRVYQRFSEHSFVEVNWDLVIECTDTETALPIFAKLFSNIL